MLCSDNPSIIMEAICFYFIMQLSPTFLCFIAAFMFSLSFRFSYSIQCIPLAEFYHVQSERLPKFIHHVDHTTKYIHQHIIMVVIVANTLYLPSDHLPNYLSPCECPFVYHSLSLSLSLSLCLSLSLSLSLSISLSLCLSLNLRLLSLSYFSPHFSRYLYTRISSESFRYL